MNSEFKVW